MRTEQKGSHYVVNIKKQNRLPASPAKSGEPFCTSLECNEETIEKAKAYLKEHSSYRLDDYTDEELPTAAAYSWFVHYFSRVGNDTESNPTFSENKLRNLIRFCLESKD